MPAAKVMATIRASRAANAARILLNRLPLDPATPAGNAMLLTRALLEASRGEGLSALRHKEWAHETAATTAVNVADETEVNEDGDSGPGACWAEYAHDAIEIIDDFIDCLNEIQWWDFFGEYRCDAIYIVRAELAFMWLINCSGPFPFKG
jgi:hypothetical protein